MTFRTVLTIVAAPVLTLAAVKLLDELMNMEKGQER